MRLTAAFVSHELLTQARSLRFRTFAGLYVMAGSAPAALIHFRRTTVPFEVGAGAYAFEVGCVLPLVTALFAFLLSLDGITREQGEGAWTTITLCEVSNAGYLLRRWLALQVLILPLTALPMAAAAGFAFADGTAPEPWTFAGPWLLHVVPLALAVSALGLGMGTIGGGALGALPLLATALALLPLLVNQLVHRFGLRFGGALEWIDVDRAMWSLSRSTQFLVKRSNPYGWTFPLPVSESGFDARVLGEQILAAGAFPAALAALALGIATVYLRRTRPDVKPRTVRPDHPFLGLLRTWGRMRERYKPDPAPAAADRFALAAGVLIAAALLGLLVHRGLFYQAVAQARFDSETSEGIARTPLDVVPGRWRIEGRVGPGRAVELRVAGEMLNQGRTPAGHLAFQLDPDLRIEVTADAGRVLVDRAWDQLGVELAPPIPPGGRRELRFRLAGEPGRAVFPGQDEGSFAGNFVLHRDGPYSRDRIPFAYSYKEPAVSGYRVDLSRGALVPLPRYGAWKGKVGPAPETAFPMARIEMALSGPAGVFLADSCGGIARPAPDGGRDTGTRLESRCRLPLPDLMVAGGRQRLLRGGGPGMAVAVFPAHRRAAELHLGFLAGSTGLLEEAWPGMGSLGNLVVLDWPHEGIHARGGAWSFRGWYREPGESFLTVAGNLVFLQEMDLVRMEALPPENLAAEILASRLAGRRRVDPGQNLFFRWFFHTLALQRLGLGPARGAVVGPVHPQDEAGIHASALAEDPWYAYWSFRFPALISALESRMGAEPLRAAVEELLARGDDPAAGPATAQELFGLLERHSPRPLERMIRDFFLAGDLPELGLDGVEFRKAGMGLQSGWLVTGRMVNQGRGEAICKVVLTTDLAPESAELRAGTGESAGFALATRHRPQGVFLDPNLECHRLVVKGASRDRVYFEGTK
ncbi:MAG: hypothetical protein ACJ759_05565 [Thermoanaerobaculia bacterium]